MVPSGFEVTPFSSQLHCEALSWERHSWRRSLHYFSDSGAVPTCLCVSDPPWGDVTSHNQDFVLPKLATITKSPLGPSQKEVRQRRNVPLEQVTTAGLRAEARLQDNGPKHGL